MLFSLLLPRGLWGAIEARFGLRLLPVGYRLVLPTDGRRCAGDDIADTNRTGSKAHDHAFRQDHPDHRRRLRHRRAHRRTRRPARRRRDRRRHARAGRRSAAPSSRRTSRPRPASTRSLRSCRSRFDALCNVAGLSGKTGAASTLAVNFYGLRALSEAMAPKTARRRRHRQCRLDRRLSAGAPISTAQASMVGIEGFPDVARGRRRPRRQERGRLSRLQGTAAAVDLAAPRISSCSRTAASASMR